MPAKPVLSVFKLGCSFPVGHERNTALHVSVLLNRSIDVQETPALCTKLVLSFVSFYQLRNL